MVIEVRAQWFFKMAVRDFEQANEQVMPSAGNVASQANHKENVEKKAIKKLCWSHKIFME
jgi:hypothetical protein